MWDYLIGLDTDILLWLNSFHSPFWDYFMKVATDKFVWSLFYLSIITALWNRYGIKGMVVIVVSSTLIVLIADQLTATILRPMLARLRPSHPENPVSELVHLVDEYRAGRFGFPSSHAANTFAIATFLSLLIKKTRFIIVMGFWAVLNCYSRIYLGVHYPGDLLFGGMIGVIVGLLFYWILMILTRNWPYLKSFNKPIPSRIIWSPLNGVEFYPSDLPVLIFILTLLFISLGFLFSS